MAVRATLVGDKRLKKKLKQWEKKVMDAAEAGVESGAMVVRNDAKRRAPYRTGNYRRSIKILTITRNPGEIEAQIGTDITDPPYPVFLEFGTSYMEPRPTLRPALDENKMEALQEIQDALKQLL